MPVRLFAFTLPIVSGGRVCPAGRSGPQAGRVGALPPESWSVNQALTLRRREDVPPAAYPFAKIVFRMIPDRGRAASRPARAETWTSSIVTRDQVPVAQKSADFLAKNRLVKVPQFLTVTVVLQLPESILADPRVRRGVDHGVAAGRHRAAALPA